MKRAAVGNDGAQNSHRLCRYNNQQPGAIDTLLQGRFGLLHNIYKEESIQQQYPAYKPHYP